MNDFSSMTFRWSKRQRADGGVLANSNEVIAQEERKQVDCCQATAFSTPRQQQPSALFSQLLSLERHKQKQYHHVCENTTESVMTSTKATTKSCSRVQFMKPPSQKLLFAGAVWWRVKFDFYRSRGLKRRVFFIGVWIKVDLGFKSQLKGIFMEQLEWFFK